MSQKKRKSDVNMTNLVGDTAGAVPSKKEKPWYDDEFEQQQANSSLMIPDPPEKERRRSLIGQSFGQIGGFLKKMRSTSALKEKNNKDTPRMSLSGPLTQTLAPTVETPPTSTSLVYGDDTSFRSENSLTSADTMDLPNLMQNAELLRFVANVDGPPSEGVSFTSDSHSESMSTGSMTSLCTPSRVHAFHRGTHRSSIKSMPGESELVKGLCNSAVRRTHSSGSGSDSFVHPAAAFIRKKSMRLRQRITGSMADLPEEKEEVPPPPIAEAERDVEEDEANESVNMRTPVQEAANTPDPESSASLWTKKPRMFGSNKKRRSNASLLDANMTCPDLGNVSMFATPENVGNQTMSMKRSTPSSSSIQRTVSTVLKNIGLRSSAKTPTGIVKRASVNEKQRTAAIKLRRCSDVSSVKDLLDENKSKFPITNSVSNEDGVNNLNSKRPERQKSMKEAQACRHFIEKLRISDEPLLKTLENGLFDAVVVDVLANGKPLSETAHTIMRGPIAAAIHAKVMSNPHQHGVYTPAAGPSMIYIACDSNDLVDKRVRTGCGVGMREAFDAGNIKSVLLYPFYRSPAEWENELVLDEFLTMALRAFEFNIRKAEEFGLVTLAAISPEGVDVLKARHEKLMRERVLPRVEAVEKREAEAANESTLL